MLYVIGLYYHWTSVAVLSIAIALTTNQMRTIDLPSLHVGTYYIGEWYPYLMIPFDERFFF